MPEPAAVRAVCVALQVPVVDGMLAAGYLTPADLDIEVLERPAAGAHTLGNRELLAELARRLERNSAGAAGVIDPPNEVRHLPPPLPAATQGEQWAARRKPSK